MNKVILTLCGVVMLLPDFVRAGDFNDARVSHVEFPGWFIKSPFHELNEDLRAARTAGKQGLMVLYSTQGCSYCTLFVKKNLADPEIVATIQKHFDAVGMEIFDDAELIDPGGNKTTIKEFASQEGVMFSPTILFYGLDGKRLFKLTGYPSPERFKAVLQYVTDGHYRTVTFAEYLQRNKPKNQNQRNATLKSDPLFSKPPHLLQRNVIAAQQPLLVIFEEPGNQEVSDFHAGVLSNNNIRKSLGQFEVVRLNAMDEKSVLITPDGFRKTPAEWYREKRLSRVPALLFYTKNGTEVLVTDELVQKQRMINSVGFVLDEAYKKGWTYQRYARTKAIERMLNRHQSQ